MVLRVLVVIAMLLGVAHAEDKPWAAGVSAEDQKRAISIYEAANTLFEQAQFKPALDMYEQALALWKHPAVYYNAAVCLVNLARPVDADDYFEKSLAFGEEPLGPELFAEAKKYRDKLAGELANLEIIVKEKGAVVSLDGKPVLESPGTRVVRVTAQEKHELVAKKPGYETKSQAIILEPGETTKLELTLKLLEGSKWKPWAVVALGGVIATGGGVMLAKSFADYDAYDRAVAEVCPCASKEDFLAQVQGTPNEGNATKDKDARRETIIAYSAFAVGGVAIAAGLYWVFTNRGSSKPTVTPTASADRVGAMITVPW